MPYVIPGVIGSLSYRALPMPYVIPGVIGSLTGELSWRAGAEDGQWPWNITGGGVFTGCIHIGVISTTSNVFNLICRIASIKEEEE